MATRRTRRGAAAGIHSRGCWIARAAVCGRAVPSAAAAAARAQSAGAAPRRARRAARAAPRSASPPCRAAPRRARARSCALDGRGCCAARRAPLRPLAPQIIAPPPPPPPPLRCRYHCLRPRLGPHLRALTLPRVLPCCAALCARRMAGRRCTVPQRRVTRPSQCCCATKERTWRQKITKCVAHTRTRASQRIASYVHAVRSARRARGGALLPPGSVCHVRCIGVPCARHAATLPWQRGAWRGAAAGGTAAAMCAGSCGGDTHALRGAPLTAAGARARGAARRSAPRTVQPRRDASRHDTRVWARAFSGGGQSRTAARPSDRCRTAQCAPSPLQLPAPPPPHRAAPTLPSLAALCCAALWRVQGGCTPLHEAASHGHPSVVTLLCKRGADKEAHTAHARMHTCRSA
jgi:hypothetical protein